MIKVLDQDIPNHVNIIDNNGGLREGKVSNKRVPLPVPVDMCRKLNTVNFTYENKNKNLLNRPNIKGCLNRASNKPVDP